jgi:hypothetical protein
MSKDSKLCPSWKCDEGSILLGMVKEDGRVSFIDKRLIINEDFVETARRGRQPEERFRFANSCIQDNCKHWKSSRCNVIDTVIEILHDEKEDGCLPSCSIRPECRWFAQRGSKACSVCPDIIRNLG